MRARTFWIGVAVLAVGVGIYVVASRNGLFASGGHAGTATAAPPAAFAMPVPVARPVRRNVPIFLDYPARVESIRNVTLQARVSGYVQEQRAIDGVDVKTGELLYRIDPRDYQATLQQVRAQGQRDAAALDYARSNQKRGTDLSKSGFLARDTFDQRNSTLAQAEATLNADKAAMRTAELNLGYTEIRAPFNGRLGRNQAPTGTLISIAGAALNTLVQLDPVYVTFNPSETDLAALQKARAKGKVATDITVAGDTGPRRGGEVTFIDNNVDRATGTITARATIPNADFTLLPGQYVQVRLRVREQPNALMVPQAAIGSSQLGKYVFVVGAGNHADQRLVTLGPVEGDLVAVTKGLMDGDQVITGNLQKIGPGAPVKPLPPQVSASAGQK